MTYHLTICTRLGSTVLPLKTIAHHQRLPTTTVTTHYIQFQTCIYVTGNWRVTPIVIVSNYPQGFITRFAVPRVYTVYSSLQNTTYTRIKTNPASLSQRNTSFTGSPWQQATRLLHSTILGFQAGTRCVTSSLPYILVNQCTMWLWQLQHEN